MKRIKHFGWITFVVVLGFVSACGQENKIPSAHLNGKTITYFMYQIQDLETKSAIDLLASKPYDMLIVEPGINFKETPYDTPYLVKKLRKKQDGSDRILLAYIDIGQAEDYRSYWADNWVAPTSTQPGTPSFLRTIDPDGWSGNYPVAYWETDWQKIWLQKNGLIEQIAHLGFDGVYLDWVEAYDDDAIRAYAKTQGIQPEMAMMKFIDAIRKKGKGVNPDFLIVVQNAPYLIDANASYYTSIIDAVSMEDTWFYGNADAEWGDPKGGDLQNGERQEGAYSTARRIRQYTKYLERNIPVFTVDYCLKPDHAAFVYTTSRKSGFVPLVTQVSLSRTTETPPF